MARHQESLDGGLWTAEDPALLEQGQLSSLRNAVYLPKQKGLTRATGRTSFGQVSATGTTGFNVDGLRDINFDNGDHYIVAMTPSAYSTAVVGDTGTFAALTTAVTGGAQLERIHYRNRFYLLNGVTSNAGDIDTNQTVYLSSTAAGTPPTVRQMGMLPVTAAPTVTSSATAFSQTVTGYYEYWTTEVAKIIQDGQGTTGAGAATVSLESAFSSETNPTTIYVASTATAPVIQMPTVRNTAITTHWRIYRSPKKDKESDRMFPAGFMISEQATASAQVVDTLAVASASALSTLASTGTALFSDWSGATALFASGSVFSSATATALAPPKSQGVYGYSFGGFVGNVKGIQVTMAAYIASGTGPAPSAYPLTVTIGKRRTDGGFVGTLSEFAQGIQKIAAKSVNITATAVGSPQTVTVGASADRWFASDKPGLVDADFDGNFMTMIETSKAGVLAVDYVKVFVYYASTVDGTVQYPTIVYTFGDIVSQVSKNHPPPSSSTGDLYEDSVVVNDVSNPAIVRWSFPGEPEYFPPTYFIDFETQENDHVTNIKTVNNVLIVGLKTSLWKINSLPSERSASFERGKAIEVISNTYGITNEMCACVFTMPGRGDLLAFVSDSGIHATDGFGFDTYTDGINWSGIISNTSTSAPIALINDPTKQELLFYYRNDGLDPETFQCLHLNYSTEHLQGGRPKVSGPVHMRNAVGAALASLESAWPVRRSTGQTQIYLGYGGTATAASAGSVLRENGTTIPAADATMGYVTRRMYLADFANEWLLGDMFGYTGSYSGTPAITYMVERTKTNDAGPVTAGSKSITLGGQKLHMVSPRIMGEGMRVSASITASAFTQEMLVIDGENWGEQNSGR